MMLELFDRGRRRIALLQNALDISTDERMNALSYLNFSLPYNDPKLALCQPFRYVRLDKGQLYRILPRTVGRSDTGLAAFTCEHVIATLMDTILFGFHTVGNKGVYTKDSIKYVLSRQSDWVLGECDFAFQYEYGWEQENLLGALFSIPQPFTGAYLWSYDTARYPWTVSLKRLDQNALPGLYIRDGRNMLSMEHQSDPAQICTRLYPLGYGEGVNQLGIAPVNKGLPYIQSPKPYTDRYGIVERVWVDRRYENAQSLLAAAKAMLEELQEPYEEYRVGFAELTAGDRDRAGVGQVVRMVDRELGIDKRTVITGVKRVYGSITDSSITIANKPRDIASTVADLADRQRIESTYSQGATNLYAQSLQANADAKNGAVMSFFIPREMRVVNRVMAKVKLSAFRAYSKATTAKGGTEESTKDGGASTATSEFKDSSTETSQSEGGIEVDSQKNDRETSNLETYEGQGYPLTTEQYTEGDRNVHYHRIDISTLKHYHNVNPHFHKVKANPHTHDVTIPGHSHNVSIKDHSHKFTIPAHDHQITPAIYFFGSPKSFRLLVNGVQKAVFNSTGADIDLTQYLVKDGSIPRGTWHTLSILPDGLAYVSMDLFVQGFVQSRGDLTL